MNRGVAGHIADLQATVVHTAKPEANAVIDCGLGLSFKGPADDEYGIIATGEKLRGISALDRTQDDGEDVTYIETDSMPMLVKGKIWVQTDGAVTPDDDVFVRTEFLTQEVTITFDVNFVTGNTINGTVGGITLPAVPFNTSHAQTIEDLADAIQDTPLTTVVSFNAVSRTITFLVDPNLLPQYGSPIDDFVPTTNFTVTGGASQAVDTVTESQAPSSNLLVGGFRADDDDTGAGATAVQVTQAKFLTSANANGLALVQINLP